MAASRLSAVVVLAALLSLAVPAPAWADESRRAGCAWCAAVTLGADRDGPPAGPASSPRPNEERVTGPLAGLPGADEASPRGDGTVLRAATVLIALGVIAATAGLCLALQGRRPATVALPARVPARANLPGRQAGRVRARQRGGNNPWGRWS